MALSVFTTELTHLHQSACASCFIPPLLMSKTTKIFRVLLLREKLLPKPEWAIHPFLCEDNDLRLGGAEFLPSCGPITYRGSNVSRVQFRLDSSIKYNVVLLRLSNTKTTSPCVELKTWFPAHI